MSTTTAIAGEPTAFQRGLILFTVTLASTLYGTTILVVSVILPEMQGSLSATQDQISWAMTLNILATAVVTPMTGWLVARLGRRNVMIWSQVGFVIATLFCGLAESLETLVIYRVLQGAFGAPIVPLGQATILDSFPKEKHGFATSVFGMGVVVGPVIGPVLGGELAELYNWRWAFFMIVPVGLLGILGLWLTLTDAGRQGRVRFDWTGFLALSVAVACLQLVLDRGERLDWMESLEIVLMAGIGIGAFYLFVAHSLTHAKPFLDPKLLLDRNYALGLCLVAIYGMLNFTPMVLFPPMLQTLMGYPNDVIGMLVAARGIGALIGFFLAIYVGKLDPRIGMLAGMTLQILSGFHMMTFDLNVTFYEVGLAGFVQGVSIGVFWVPLTLATFSTIPRERLAETSAIFHLLRNIGSSVFIALSVTVVIRTGGVNYARMTEFVTPFNENLARSLPSGIWSLSDPAGLAALGLEIERQAGMIGYLNAFMLYTVACMVTIPLILLFKIRKGGDDV